MYDLLELHKYFISPHLKDGDIAVDFTMGNGHDTEYLCKAVGEHGHVYAFDIQPAAIESTRKHLQETHCPENYTLILDSHHKVKDYVKGKIKAGMFNLGWLPGGDHAIHTMRETTMPAIEAALDLLDDDAILNIAIYPGHEEGDLEGEMICKYFESIPHRKATATKIKMLNSPSAPYFIVIETPAKKH